MPFTPLTVTNTAAAGTVLPAAVAVDQGNGNVFPNTGREVIEITNGAAANTNVTFITYGTYAVGPVLYAIADLTVTVTNATSKVCGPFDKALFNNANASVEMTWTSGNAVTARVLSMGTS